MTGINGSLHKMFRWLKEKRAKNNGGGGGKHETNRNRKSRGPEDDYGFGKKKQIILQETENGHSVIIKDDETTVVYPQSFCKLNYRARMPTPVQNVHETSTHIYDEIPEIAVRTRLQIGANHTINQNEADIIKDTRSSSSRNVPMDFKNAIEVGPYLIVPIVNSSNSSTSNGDVEIFKRNEAMSDGDSNSVPATFECHCPVNTQCTCNNKESYNPPWDSNASVPNGQDASRDTKVVLTRCVKSKNNDTILTLDALQSLCSLPGQSESNACSFVNGACNNSDSDSPTLTEVSDTRTLIETLDEASELSELSESCALSEETSLLAKASKNVSSDNAKSTEHIHLDGSDTCCEYDLSTSGESDKSAASDYELYLSKIENNLKLKHDCRKMADSLDSPIPESEADGASIGAIGDENDTMTYVSSLSEYSSAASHISDISADRSASDDSSGYYECSEEVNNNKTESREKKDKKEKKRDRRVSLERSVSAPEAGISGVKIKKNKDKSSHSKSKKSSSNSRSHSFDHKISGFSSSDEKEVYKFPSSKKSGSKSAGSRPSRGKAVLAPQPTPVYMDPYRGKGRSHNRLLGDLIRMNYDKQLFTH